MDQYIKKLHIILLIISTIEIAKTTSFVLCHCSAESCKHENFKCRSERFCYSHLRKSKRLEIRNTSSQDIIKYEQLFYTEDSGCVSFQDENNGVQKRCLDSLDEEMFNRTLVRYSLMDTKDDPAPIFKCCHDNSCNKPRNYLFTFTDQKRISTNTKKSNSFLLSEINFNWYTLGAMSLSVLVTIVILLQLGILCGRKMSLSKIHQDSLDQDSLPKMQSHLIKHSRDNSFDLNNMSDELKINSNSLQNYPTMSCRSCDSSRQTNSDCQAVNSGLCHLVRNGSANDSNMVHTISNTNITCGSLSSDVQIMPTMVSSSTKCQRKINSTYANVEFSSMTPSGPFTRYHLQPFNKNNSEHSSINNFTSTGKGDFFLNKGYGNSTENCQHYAEAQLTSIYQQVSSSYMDPNYSQTPIDRFTESDSREEPLLLNKPLNSRHQGTIMTKSNHMRL